MSGVSRRTIVSVLGLAPVGAIGAESFIEPLDDASTTKDIQSVASGWRDEKCAAALEKMAAEIRSGRVMVERLNVSADLSANTVADTHELMLRFIHCPERA